MHHLLVGIVRPTIVNVFMNTIANVRKLKLLKTTVDKEHIIVYYITFYNPFQKHTSYRPILLCLFQRLSLS